MIKVVKFGGSSLASAEQFKKVGNIIRADEDRKYVVPSAPGKRFQRILRLLICFTNVMQRQKLVRILRRVLRQLRKDTMKLSRDLDLSFH